MKNTEKCRRLEWHQEMEINEQEITNYSKDNFSKEGGREGVVTNSHAVM